MPARAALGRIIEAVALHVQVNLLIEHEASAASVLGWAGPGFETIRQETGEFGRGG